MATSRFALLATALVLCNVAAFAQQASERAVALDIAPQPLGDALNALAQQANLQLVFYSEVGKGITSPRIMGKLTPKAALGQLLANTDLRYEYLDAQTVAILSQSAPLPASKGPSDSAMSATPALQAVGARSTRLAQADVPAGTEATPQQGTLEELEEIVVTGTHIRGAENNTAAVTVLDRAYIDSTGISTTHGLIESLPQNFSLASQSGVFVPGVSSNKEQGTSVNLRAIGEGTTLVLLNGRRLAPGFAGAAADISALPLSAIERVEVLTDGASALYGSDAIGGVVNFILRKDFDGADTRLRLGRAEGGVDERRISQLLGHAWDSGNALLSVEYYKRDLLPARERDFVPSTSLIGSLLPRDENISAMFSGRQEVSESLSVFADALYSRRKSYNQGGRTIANEDNDNVNPQTTAALGLAWQAGGDWQIEASGSYARNKLDQAQLRGAFLFDSLFEIKGAQLKADGSLFTLPAGKVRLALGADWRSEDLSTRFEVVNLFVTPFEADQIVRSAFVEANVPIVDTANARTGLNRLELSLAARVDDYSTFGSSFDPRIGLMWEPMQGLRFRGSYGTSYKAPNLIDYTLSTTFAQAVNGVDPGAPGGVSSQLQVLGNDVAGFRAQESESASFGVELSPSSVPGLKLALNYYRIRYSDRIATPADGDPGVILGNPASFGQLFIRDPSAADVNEAIAIGQQGLGFFVCDNLGCEFNPPGFDPSTIDVVVDTRRRNLSALKTNGLDLSVDYGFPAAGGTVRLGLDGTYIFELEQQVTSISAPFDTVGTFYNPPDWRVRASAGWRRQAWSANLFVNHSASYTDNRTSPTASISSYTTVDSRIAYAFDTPREGGLTSGLALSLSVQNLFDEDPPRAAIVNTLGDMGFDPTNANPLGRFVALELQKTW